MKIAFARNRRSDINRRAFLRGVGTVAVGLPFLESLPGRSAWAQSAEPTFGFFLAHSCGVVASSFWPAEAGPLTTEGLAAEGKAVSALSEHASRILLINGIRFPAGNSGCGHAQGLCQVLTGAASNGAGGNQAQSTAPSADTLIAQAVNPSGVEPLALYAGIKIGYINERLSFSAAGKVRSAEGNPYQVYKDLMGMTGSTPAAPTMQVEPGEMEAVVDELAVRRTSVNDLVREEISSLMAQSVLSQADKARLQRHFDGIRDMESSMVAQGVFTGCDSSTLDESAFQAVDGKHKQNGTQENIAMLHMQLVAYAFACNLNRTATLQVGDGTDATVYDVPSNSRGWGFHFISHRTQSDGAVGNDQTAAAAHAEIDTLRMENFKKGIDIFASYGTATGSLLDNGFFCWTNAIADGPSHSYNGVPYLIAGSGGGLIKQGEYLNLGGSGGGGFGGGGGSGPTNDKVLNALKSACGLPTEDMLPEMITTA